MTTDEAFNNFRKELKNVFIEICIALKIPQIVEWLSKIL